jgi:site-specific DNA-cytosine methylase
MLPGQGRYEPIEGVCELQGLPATFVDRLAYTKEALRIMLGNGVPMAMGRALAKAVKEAVEETL